MEEAQAGFEVQGIRVGCEPGIMDTRSRCRVEGSLGRVTVRDGIRTGDRGRPETDRGGGNGGVPLLGRGTRGTHSTRYGLGACAGRTWRDGGAWPCKRHCTALQFNTNSYYPRFHTEEQEADPSPWELGGLERKRPASVGQCPTAGGRGAATWRPPVCVCHTLFHL
jgi:hypothetical protein